MRRKILAVAAALVLGTATMTPDTIAAGRGGRGHGFSGGYRGHGYGLNWYPYYGYDYGPTDEFSEVTSATPSPVWLAPEPARAPIICRETVTVPSEDGGTRQIRIIRC